MSRTATRKGGARTPLSNSARFSLHESYAGPAVRVDRAAGVIYGVKVLGATSPNCHGKAGVTGTDYTANARRSAVPLYEGIRVNKNHPDRRNPGADRKIEDRIGWLSNVREEADGVFADLNLFTSDPDAAKLFEAAERNPACFGLSHNADGHGEIRNKRLVIDKLLEARSVDIVADAGSVKGLFESKQPKGRNAMTLREALEKIKLNEKQITRLFEMDDSSLLKPDMDATASPEVTEDESYEQHLGKAIVAILNDAAMDQEAKKKKVLGILKLTGDEETPAPVAGDITESDDDEPKDEDKDKDEKKEVKESRERLTKLEGVLDLCESLQFAPTKTQRKLLSKLDTDAERKELIESLKGVKGKDAKGNPIRSGAGHRINVNESALPKDAKEQAAVLLRA